MRRADNLHVLIVMIAGSPRACPDLDRDCFYAPN